MSDENTLTWNPSGAPSDIFYKIRLVDSEGRIFWTIHKGSDDWWIGTPNGDVDGHYVSEEAARKRCVRLATVEDNFTINVNPSSGPENARRRD